MASSLSRLFAYRPRLPDEALDQLRAIIDNYNRLRTGVAPQYSGDDKEIQTLSDRLNRDPQSISWSDIAVADLCVIDLLDMASLRGRLDGWRRRMAEVIGPIRYAAYLATACDAEHAEAADLRADIAECIRAVYYFYTSYGIAARSRSEVSKSLFRVALGVLIVLVVFAVLFAFRSQVLPFVSSNVVPTIEWLLATSAVAVVGSVISVQRRLQDPKLDVDPMYRYIQTTADWFSTAFVSPVFGAIFGCLMYGLLASNLLGSSLVDFKGATTPTAGKDQAALLILGFIAGFAEQLIPDALSRIAARALGTVTGAGTPPAPTPQIAPTQSGAQGNGTPGRPGPAIASTVDAGKGVVRTPLSAIGSAVKLQVTPPLTPEANARGDDSRLASLPMVQPDGEGGNANA